MCENYTNLKKLKAIHYFFIQLLGTGYDVCNYDILFQEPVSKVKRAFYLLMPFAKEESTKSHISCTIKFIEDHENKLIKYYENESPINWNLLDCEINQLLYNYSLVLYGEFVKEGKFDR